MKSEIASEFSAGGTRLESVRVRASRALGPESEARSTRQITAAAVLAFASPVSHQLSVSTLRYLESVDPAGTATDCVTNCGTGQLPI